MIHDFACPGCSTVAELTGKFGKLDWLKCERCGTEFPVADLLESGAMREKVVKSLELMVREVMEAK